MTGITNHAAIHLFKEIVTDVDFPVTTTQLCLSCKFTGSLFFA